MIVNLTYFKDTGKYYTEGSFRVSNSIPLHKIWEDVERRRDSQSLPGLGSGLWEGPILVDVPGHPHNHPHLSMPRARQ